MDVIGTAIQVKELAQAGSELVRITVNTPEAAQAVPHIREQLDRMGITVPLIGDFHYNGHTLLSQYPACAETLSKYRINPDIEKYDRVQVDRGESFDSWEAVLLRTLGEVREVYGYFNNHWAGHSPASANEMKRRLGLDPLEPRERWSQGELF